MRSLSAFTQMTLDGYYADATGDLSWAHRPADDTEWHRFVTGNAGGGGTLVMGRVTYELMIRYWPTPMAAQHDPEVAAHMNALPKLVFSRTLNAASWSNTTVVSEEATVAMKRIKAESGSDLAILGSGTLVRDLARAGLIDEFQIVVNPVVLGAGRKLFEAIGTPLRLERREVRSFGNGNVFIRYRPRGATDG